MFIYEESRFGDNEEFIAVINEEEYFNIPIHLHRCFEFIFIYEGQLRVCIDNDSVDLSAGESVLIFPNQMHSYYAEIPIKILISIFSPTYINMFYQFCRNKKQEKIVTKLSSEVMDYIVKNLPRSTNNFMIKACLYAICSDILEKTNLIDNNTFDDNNLFRNILTYIESNFTSNISLRQIAKTLGYDYHYTSRFFNNQFKIPFSRFVNEYRINYAIYLVKNSNKSITDICYECGYKNIRSFNRNFYNITKKTPTEYR